MHLTYDDLKRYVMESDFSDEYLCWSNSVVAHLDECADCRNKLDKFILVSEVCAEENAAASFQLVRKEETLRRELVALKLEALGEAQRMQEVIRRLRAGMLNTMLVEKADFLKRQSIVRGGDEMEKDANIVLQYTAGKVTVSVACNRDANATVILVENASKDMMPMVATAIWSEELGRAVAEFEVKELGTAYVIYVDVAII